jgi:hypothetical protein
MKKGTQLFFDALIEAGSSLKKSCVPFLGACSCR